MGNVRKGVVLYGKKKEDDLIGTTYGVDELHAGKYGAVLVGNGGPGADKYYGGPARDEFIHGMITASEQKVKIGTTHEIIYDYTSGQDDIYYGGTFKNGKVSGRDVILNFSTGTVRVNNGAGKSITLISSKDDSEKNYTFGRPVLAKGLSYQNNKAKLLVQAPFKGTIKKWSYDSSVKEIDARSVKTKINIEGNQGNLTIRAGQAGGTIWAGSGNDTIYGGKGVDVFRYQRKDEGDPDGRDKIYNYESGRDIIRVEKGYYRMYTDGNDVILNFGEKHKEINHKRISVGADTVRIVDGAGKKIVIEDGNGRRVAKTLYRKMPAYTSYKNGKLVVSNKNTRIDLRIYNYKDIRDVDAVNTKGAVIYGGKNFVKLKGSKNGADELWAGTGGAKMYGNGGKGTDIYHGSSGDDNFYHGIVEGSWTSIYSNEVVHNYTSGQDEIDYRGKFLGGQVKGRDVVLRFNNGTMRIINGVGKAIDLYSEENGSDIIRTFGKPNLPKGLSYQNNRQKLVVKAPFKGSIKWGTYDSTVKEIDARAMRTAVNIDGLAGNETIRAGQGGGTLWGGRGNDALYGGTGVDVFLFHKKDEDDEEDGQDKIYNYESGRDIIRIERDKYQLSASGNDVIIKVGGPQYTWKNNRKVSLGVDSLRIVNGVGKNIIIQDAKGKHYTRVNKAAGKKNSLSYLTKVQGVSSTKTKSLMHLSAKKSNTMSNITMAGNGQPAPLNLKKIG